MASLAAREPALTLAETARMIRELEQLADAAIKNKDYQASPIGKEVRRFLAALQFQGSPANTLDTYETVLARLAIDYADFRVEWFCDREGVAQLRDFLARHWGESSIETRRNRLHILRSFFKWQVEERGLEHNPAARIKPPRARDTLRVAHQPREIHQLLSGQDTLRDSCALALMCRLGLRKNDLRLLRVGDIDLTRDVVYLRNRKGDDDLAHPIEYEQLRNDLYLHLQAERRHAKEFLVYPKSHRFRPMDPSAFHRWFKRCLDRAGLPDFPMHELRHTAGDEMWRVTGNPVAAQQLLGHKSLETTRRYLHPTPEDLRAAMRVVASSWSEGEEG